MIEPLTLNETRVLGVLVEKARTVPDTYPLSLNALVAGCNQRTSRDPVLTLAERDAIDAIERLRAMNLVIESGGARVLRYSHNLERVLGIPAQSAAILAVLMLRGPQTAGELRLNCERLHRFADISAVEAFLHELRERRAGALVVELPRRAGERENRWAHLLSREVAPADDAAASAEHAPPAAVADATTGLTELAALKQDVERLRADLNALAAEVAALRNAARGTLPPGSGA